MRDVYVRTLPTIIRCEILWKLTRLLYEILKASRQQLCAVEQRLTESQKLQRVPGVDKLFYRRGDDVSVLLFVTKVVDDFIVARSRYMLQTFWHQLNCRFKLGNVKWDKKFKFLGCIIPRDTCRSISLSMPRYLEDLPVAAKFMDKQALLLV